jgi:hypothetical protein
VGTTLANCNFQESPPDSQEITEYDRRHLVDYLRLLDADSEGAGWKDAATIILGLDVDKDKEAAKSIHESHLNRAKWISQSGYAALLKKP